MNPLLDFSGLPRFGDFKPEHVSPAIETLLAENRALVQRLAAADVPGTWDDFVEPMWHVRLARKFRVCGLFERQQIVSGQPGSSARPFRQLS